MTKAEDEMKYYNFVRQDLLDIVPEIYGTVLDVGCGAGATMMHLLKKGAEEVTGIELSQDACEQAWKRNLNVIQADIQKDELPLQEKSFDFILFADVLEHLYDPWTTLRGFVRLLKEDGTILLSIPNVKYYRVLRKLLFSDEWAYVSAGVLDFTHVRFFTRKEAKKLVVSAGLDVIHIDYRKNKNKVFSALYWLLGEKVMTVWPEQFLISAKKAEIHEGVES